MQLRPKRLELPEEMNMPNEMLVEYVRRFPTPHDAFCLMDTRDFLGYDMTEEEKLFIFQCCNAYWRHSGDPKQPHAQTTQDLCTNAFFDCFKVLKYTKLSELFAQQHARMIRRRIGNVKIDWLIGSPMAGITYAHDLAKALGVPIAHFTEKDPQVKKKMIWNRERIPVGASVLQAEELITTAGTSDAVRLGVMEGNQTPVNFLPFLPALVHRPPKLVTHYGDREVIAFIEQEVWAVEQEQCTLCPKGSKRLRPKQNWEELNGRV